MIYFCLSFFLFLLPIIFLLIYIFIKIEKIELRQTKTEAKIEREYQHLLNNIKNIENFLKHEHEK
jgi:ABC-type multidrug transport system fused ATPase/permease subunit